MWDLPGPGIEPMSPALAGGFLTTVPPGKTLIIVISRTSFSYLVVYGGRISHDPLISSWAEVDDCFNNQQGKCDHPQKEISQVYEQAIDLFFLKKSKCPIDLLFY